MSNKVGILFVCTAREKQLLFSLLCFLKFFLKGVIDQIEEAFTIHMHGRECLFKVGMRSTASTAFSRLEVL